MSQKKRTARRKFLKATAAGAVTASVGPFFLTKAWAAAPINEPATGIALNAAGSFTSSEVANKTALKKVVGNHGVVNLNHVAKLIIVVVLRS